MSILIKNCTLIPMDEEKEKVLYQQDVLIEGNKITKIGKDIHKTVDRVIDGTNKILLPGFINTHTHLAMSIFRESTSGYTLQEWLTDYIFPREDKLTEEDIYYATLLSGIEMIECGVTTANDLYFYTEQTIKALKKLSLDCVVTRCVMDIDGKGKERLEELKSLINDYTELNFSVGIHGLYTCSEPYIKEVVTYAKEKNLPIHMHFCENQNEVQTIKKNYKVTYPSEVLEKYFQNTKTILAHCIELEEYDYKVFNSLNINVSHCPISNLKLNCGVMNLKAMRENNINISLGSDGQGSGSNLNMFEIMKITSYIHNAKYDYQIPSYELLKMATINGAKALGLEDKIGSIETSKKANLILIDQNSILMNPINNMISNIVYNGSNEIIHTVISNGKIIMDNHTINIVDTQEIINQCQKIAENIGM